MADVDETSPPNTHNAVVAGIVQLHNDALLMTQHLSSLDIQTYLSPRDFLDFISHYTIVLAEKRHQLDLWEAALSDANAPVARGRSTT